MQSKTVRKYIATSSNVVRARLTQLVEGTHLLICVAVPGWLKGCTVVLFRLYLDDWLKGCTAVSSGPYLMNCLKLHAVIDA